MSVEIAWKQNILVTDFHLLKSLLVVFGFGSQAFVCGFSRQNISSVDDLKPLLVSSSTGFFWHHPIITQLSVSISKVMYRRDTVNVLSAESTDECLGTKSKDN